MSRRIVRWLAAVLTVLLLTLAGTVWLALRSEPGLQELAALAQRLSGGSLRLGAVQGRLLGEFVIDDLHYAAADGLQVDLKRLHLRLLQHELLRRRLHLEVAELQDLQVHLPPPAPQTSSTPTTLPSRLPLDLVIDAFSLDHFKLYRQDSGHGSAAPFTVDNAALRGSWIGDQVTIAQLSAELAQTGPLQASAKARMAIDRIDFAALQLKGPGEVNARGVFGLGPAASQLQLDWKELRWPLTAAAAERLVDGLSGAGSFSGPLDHYRFELQTAALMHKLDLTLRAKGEGSLRQVQFAELVLNAGKGTAQAQGSVAWEPVLRADLKGSLAQVDPALFAAGWSGVINGSFDTRTTVQNGQPDIAFSASIDQSQLRGYPLRLSAQGDTDTRSVRLRQFLLQSGKGSLSATGTAAWSPALRADLTAQVRNFDPGQFVAAYPGSINGSIVTRTTGQGRAATIAFNIAIDQSRLRNNPLRVDAGAELRGETVTVQKLELLFGDTHLSVSGQATPPFDLAGKLDSPSLAVFDPALSGRAALTFTLQGPLDMPHLVTHGQAQGLRYQAYRVAKLDWDADLDPRQQSHLTLSLTEAQAGMDIHSLRLGLTGLEVYHHAQLDLSSDRGDLALTVDGGYDRKRKEWGGEVSAGRFAPAGLPPWALEKAAGLLLGQRRQSLEPACFSGAGGRACLRLEQNVTRAGLRLSLDIDRLLLAAFQPLLPDKYQIAGEISGGGSLEYANGDVAAIDLDLHTGGARIQAPQAPPVEIVHSSLKADDQQNHLHGVLDVQLQNGTIGADVSAAPAADFQARPLSGQLQVAVPDLGFLQSFVPQLKEVKGSIGGQLQFAGTVGLPRLQGEIALHDGAAKVPLAGIELQQVQLRLQGRGEGPLALDGSISSGGGTLSLTGTVDPSVAPPRADLQLNGQDFQALATADARIWVTPQLHLLSNASGTYLEGTLTVPKAEITPQGLGNNGVSVSSDQVIVGAEPTAEAQPLKIYSTVTVALGDAVSFQGFGLTTRLEGSVTVSEAPQRVTTGQGELRLVEGRYQAYGQDLTIQTGRLIFDGGAITKPAVDLYATRHPQSDITVGVRVRGTLDKPMLSLQSEPAMPREQQLSWLVLGRSLDQSSAGDRSAVSQAALSLGLSGGDYFAQKIGKSIGLDQISVGQGPVGGSSVAADATTIQGSQAAQNAGSSTAYSSQAAQLTLGKYLTPKLFVSYGVSLFQPGQTFRLLYDLGHGFKLQTESGVASGGDIIYTFERGH